MLPAFWGQAGWEGGVAGRVGGGRRAGLGVRAAGRVGGGGGWPGGGWRAGWGWVGPGGAGGGANVHTARKGVCMAE